MEVGIEIGDESTNSVAQKLSIELDALKLLILGYFDQNMGCYDHASQAYIETQKQSQLLHEKLCDAQYFIKNKSTFPTALEYINEAMSYSSNIRQFSNTYSMLIQRALTKYIDILASHILHTEDERHKCDQQAKALRWQVAMLMLNKDTHTAFTDMLTKISSLVSGYKSTKCYIRYAWPTEDREILDSWVQPFLMILYDHLAAAGIKPVLDIMDNQSNESVLILPEKMSEYEYVLLIGTPSLPDKHKDPFLRFDKIEMSNVHQKQDDDSKKYLQRVIPIRIMGAPEECFLSYHNNFTKISDWLETGYFTNLKELIGRLYFGGSPSAVYDSLWSNFFYNFSEYNNCLNLTNLEDTRGFEYYYSQLWSELLQKNWYQRLRRQHRADQVRPGVFFESSTQRNGSNQFDGYFQVASPNEKHLHRSKAEYEIQKFLQQSPSGLGRHALVIHGIQHVGKTQLLCGYIDKYIKRAAVKTRVYNSVIWLNVNASFPKKERQTVDQQLLNLAEQLGVSVSNRSNDLLYEGIFESLRKRGKCLIVYRDAEKLSDIKKYLPPTTYTECHIVITTQNGNARSFGAELFRCNLALGPFTLDEAKIYINNRLKGVLPEQLRLFCELHGNHPGALSRALQLISSHKIDVVGYISQATQRAIGSDYLKLLNASANLALIESLPSNAKNLLNLLACFSSESTIDIHLLDIDMAESLISQLRQYSLVTNDTRTDHYNLSPWIKILVLKSRFRPTPEYQSLVLFNTELN